MQRWGKHISKNFLQNPYLQLRNDLFICTNKFQRILE